MKYIKKYEEEYISDRRKNVIGYIYNPKKYPPSIGDFGRTQVPNDEVEEIYYYLYRLGGEPKMLRSGSIYFRFNDKIPMFFYNRSEEIRTNYYFEPEIDEEKEKEMKLFIASKKYNI